MSRALWLRCPACCGGPLFTGWLTMRESCPGCGLWLERDDGYYTGAMALNLILAEGFWIVLFVATLLSTWPNPPWDLLVWGSVALMIGVPLLLYPFSKTTWLALDLIFRPISRDEFARHRDPARASGRPPA